MDIFYCRVYLGLPDELLYNHPLSWSAVFRPWSVVLRPWSLVCGPLSLVCSRSINILDTAHCFFMKFCVKFDKRETAEILKQIWIQGLVSKIEFFDICQIQYRTSLLYGILVNI